MRWQNGIPLSVIKHANGANNGKRRAVAEATNNGGCGLWRTSTTSRFETVFLDARGSDPDPGIFGAANILLRSEAAKVR
jgi:hypothetical protein